MLQSSQKDWYAKQSCESCHQQILPAIAFRVAREHSIAVEETIASDNAIHVFSPSANLDRAVQYTHIIDPAMDDGFRLLGMDAAGVRPNVSAALYARIIASRQRPDGHWVTIDERLHPTPHSGSNTPATGSARSLLATLKNAPSSCSASSGPVNPPKNWPDWEAN